MSTAVFSFIYSEEKFFVRDEQELALIFELLKDSQDADILHWNIIMSLDEQLLQMIVSYTGLLACLQFLSNKNRFLFFVKLGDILSRILSKSEYFGRILASIPENQDQMKLVKILRTKGLRNMITSTRDIGNMCEWGTSETQATILLLVQKEGMLPFIASAADIYDIMYFLRAENRRLFMEIIGWDFLRSRIFSPNDFFYALKAIDLTDIEKYFSLFTQQEVRGFITSDALFRKYLLKLSYSKQEPLLHFLGYDAKQYTFQPGNS